MLMSCIVACTCHVTAAPEPTATEASSSVPSASVSLLAAPSGRSEHNEIHAPANLPHDLIKVACAGSGRRHLIKSSEHWPKLAHNQEYRTEAELFTMLKILLRFVPEFSSDMCTHIHTHAHMRICVYTHPLRRAHNDATFSSLKCLPAFVTVFASTFSFFFHSPSLSLRLFSPLSAASCHCSSLLLPLVLLPISVILASRPARLFYV